VGSTRRKARPRAATSGARGRGPRADSGPLGYHPGMPDQHLRYPASLMMVILRLPVADVLSIVMRPPRLRSPNPRRSVRLATPNMATLPLRGTAVPTGGSSGRRCA